MTVSIGIGMGLHVGPSRSVAMSCDGHAQEQADDTELCLQSVAWSLLIPSVEVVQPRQGYPTHGCVAGRARRRRVVPPRLAASEENVGPPGGKLKLRAVRPRTSRLRVA